MKYIVACLLLFNSIIHAEPIRIIFDTDIGNDVDDVLALAMIHNLEKRGACKLLAVTVTKDHPKAAAFTDVVNTFYGRGDVPIGVVRNGATPEEGRFNKLADDAEKYPHDLKSGEDAPEAVGLLRKILAAQPDNSVALIQVGFFTNFSRLIDSQPDEHSPLNGKDLITKKVKVLSVMAGAFQTIKNSNYYLEYNVIKDIPAAQKLAKEWPTAILWCGYEIGINAEYPHESILKDYEYVPHHPVKDSYVLYNPPPHNRPTWDQATMMAVVLADRGYFDLSPKGTVEVLDDGFTKFKLNKEGRDQFLIMSPLQAERVKEAIVQLSSEPPQR